MTSLFQVLMLLLNIVWFIVMGHVIMSWLINFQVLNLRQPLVAQVWDGLNRLLGPVYSRVRNVLPPMGGLDLAPLVVLIGVTVLRILLINNAPAFYCRTLGTSCAPLPRPRGLVHHLFVCDSASKSSQFYRFFHDRRCHAAS